MVFMGASTRLHQSRRPTYQHILEDVFQYHSPPHSPSPWVELKCRFEWSMITNDFIHHSSMLVAVKKDGIMLPKEDKSNIDLLKLSAGHLTLSNRNVDAPVDDDPTTAIWANTENTKDFLSYSDSKEFDHDFYDSRLPLSLTPSTSTSSSGGSTFSWSPSNDEAELSLIHLAQDTLQYIHSFPTYSDELLSLVSKLDDYLEQSW